VGLLVDFGNAGRMGDSFGGTEDKPGWPQTRGALLRARTPALCGFVSRGKREELRVADGELIAWFR